MTLQTWLATGIILMPVLSAALLFARRESGANAGLVGATGSGLSLALIVVFSLAAGPIFNYVFEAAEQISGISVGSRPRVRSSAGADYDAG